MFSDNSRISARQIKYLLILEWVAKFCILLPVILAGRSVGSMIFCIFLGAAAWYGVSSLVLGWLDSERGFFEQVRGTVGKPMALLACVAAGLYFLVQAAVFTNLCAELTAVYLLPEVSVPLLCLLPVLSGVYLAYGSVEIRGRFCEVTGPVVIGLMIILIAASAFGMDRSGMESVFVSEQGNVAVMEAANASGFGHESTLVSLDDRLARGGFEVFACMGGMFVPLLSGHFKKEDRNASAVHRSIRKAGLISVVMAGSLCAIAAISYGKNGMREIDFPTVRVMSNMSVPGAFWQRWDLLFLALLVVGMTVSVAGALWYIREILEVFWSLGWSWMSGRQKVNAPGAVEAEQQEKNRQNGADSEHAGKQQRNVYISWLAAAVLIYFAAAGFLNAFTAVCYYRAMNMQILIPFMFFFYIIVGFRRRLKAAEKGRSVSRMTAFVVLLFAAVFFLTGCSARDPEERLFPMALEIGMQDGKLAVTYAWSEGLGPALAQGAGESEAQKKKEEDEIQQETGNEPQENTGDGTLQENIHSAENLTTLTGNSMAEIQQLETEFTERYMDYSHVKAIILRDNLQSAPEIQREVMEWLAGEPAFASGLIVYRSGDGASGLQEAQEHSSGQVGAYLESLYKNSEKYRAMATTLGAVIAEYYA